MKILISEPTHKILINKLEENKIEYDYVTGFNQSKLQSIINDYEGLVIRSKYKIDKGFIDSAKNLIFIARAGAGMENIDVEYAESKGIKCINSPEGNRNAVAEHALGMLLTLFNRINISHNQIKNGIWDRSNIGEEIEGKTIGIIGYGNTGSSFAKKLQGFDIEILAYDKYKTGFSNDFVKEVSLFEIFNKTDIISFHVPLTDETKHMFCDKFIEKFEKDIYVINTSRGSVVKTDDLVENLKTEKIKGAVLDVLEYEKHSFEDLKISNNEVIEFLTNSENVILTPHIAGSTKQSYRKIGEVLAKKIIEFARTAKK